MGGPFAKVPSPSCLQQYLYLYSYLYLHLYLNLYFVFSPWVGRAAPSCKNALLMPSSLQQAFLHAHSPYGQCPWVSIWVYAFLLWSNDVWCTATFALLHCIIICAQLLHCDPALIFTVHVDCRCNFTTSFGFLGRCCFHCIILRQLWQYCIVASHGIAGLLLDSRAGVAFIADS